MARLRWTLALILILPILATVITAFRVRDLPKYEDSVKFDRKQKCDDCDVKLHSIKTESETERKHTHENLQKAVKQQQVDQKAGSKFDVSYEDDDHLSISKAKTDFKIDYLSSSKTKLDTNSKIISSVSLEDEDDSDIIKKSSLSKKATNIKESQTKDIKAKIGKYGGNKKDDDDDEYDQKTITSKPKPLEKLKVDLRSKSTDSKNKLVNLESDNEENNASGESKKSVTTKRKVSNVKKVEQKSKLEPLSESTDSKILSQKTEEDNYSGNHDDDDDNDDDDDDDDDEDDDDDGALSSLWETFSMLGLNIDPSLKPAEKKEKQSIPKNKKQENITKETLIVNIETLPKVKEIKKDIDFNRVGPNVKGNSQKQKGPVENKLLKKAALKIDNENGYDYGHNNDDEDKHSLKRKEQSKNVKEIDGKPTTQTKSKASKVIINSNEKDDNSEDITFLDIDKFQKPLTKNNKKTKPIKKVFTIYDDDGDDDDDDEDDEDDDDNDDEEDDEDDSKDTDGDKSFIIKRSIQTSKTSIKTTKTSQEQPTGPKKVVEIDLEDTDDDDDDEDSDDDESSTFQIKVSKTNEEKNVIKNILPSSKIDLGDHTEINEHSLKDDKKNKKSEEVAKSKAKDKELPAKNKEFKTKEDDLKTKPVKKNITIVNEVTEKEDKNKHTDTKPLQEKHKKDADKTDNAKDGKNKEKKQKKEEQEIIGNKNTPVSNEKNDDLIEGLNMHDIKKDIKAQIRSNREDNKAHKTSKEKVSDSQETLVSTETHLKHVTEALHRRNLLKSEFEDLYAFFPTFAPNFSRIHNSECRRHGQIVLRQLRGTKLWALNMLDATAKIPSGILQGNGIQLGDFDQCMGSRARVQLESGSVVKVQGKYCLARLEVKAEHPELETPVHLAQAKNLIRSRIDDPGHFVPRFSTLSWGVCVPAVCNPEDVEVIVKDAIKHYQKTSGVIVRVKVDEQDCTVEEAEWWNDWIELPTVLTLSFYAVILLFVLVATLQDFFAERKEDESEETDDKKESNVKDKREEKATTRDTKRSDNFVSFFSLYHTINKLVAPGTTDDISCIHGVRGIATIALLIAHKFLPIAVMPYTNRLKITEYASSPLWSWCRAGWMFTDCFLLLSGALTSYKASENDNVPRRLFSRYLRLTPALLAVVLFYAYIWDNLSSGPMWGTFVTKNAEVCQTGWWWNMLYVQNYFGFEDMCAPQTHQLALDMQLTILGGILLWILQVKEGASKFALPALHIFAAYSRYTSVRDHRLTMLAYHGVSVSQLYRTARLSYTSVLHRSTPYLVGLSLGSALKSPAEHSKVLLGIGWISSTALWCLVWWVGADSGSTQYRYSSSFAAQYAALAPIASALAIAWVVYAVHSGSSDFLSRFLCCRPLVLISRLSYALYLTQFIVYITNVATVKTSREFTLMSLIDVEEISAILLSSIILTVTFVIPMQSLNKMFTFSTKSESLEESEDTSVNKSENEDQTNSITVKEEKNVVETLQPKTRQHLIAHREVLEEIPEMELEYESHRDNEGLGEILEEEEDEIGEESIENVDMDDDLDIIEEEQGGEDDENQTWLNRRQYTARRSDSNENDQDVDEWEWTANGSRNGAQYYRYSR